MSTKNLPTQWNQSLFDQLTPREQAFVMHPDVFTDPQRAAIEVGYTETTARCKSHIMRKQLMYYIMPLHEKRMEQTGITIDRVKNELAAIAFANEAEFYDTIDVQTENGWETIKVVKDITRLPEVMQRAIKSVEYENTILSDGKTFQYAARVVLYDKLSALREIAEILGAKDPRFRKPTDDDLSTEEQELLRHMEPEELERVSQAYEAAAARAKKASDKIRDRRAIPGKATRVDKKT